jgi:hypothetical protein
VAVVQYTYTHKQYRERHKTNSTKNKKKLGRVRAVPRLCGFNPGICLTTEEKARENFSQGSLLPYYIIDRMVFINEAESVYCAVRSGSLHKTYFSSVNGQGRHCSRLRGCQRVRDRRFLGNGFVCCVHRELRQKQNWVVLGESYLTYASRFVLRLV